MPKAKDTTTSKGTAVTTTRRTRSSTAVSAVRTVGPAIPLAIALLGSAVLPGGKTTAPGTPTGPISSTEAQKCGGDISDFRACHDMYPTGCTISGGWHDPYINALK